MTESDSGVNMPDQIPGQVVQQLGITELSNRDRDLLLALLDDTDKEPNKALEDAAARYRKRFEK